MQEREVRAWNGDIILESDSDDPDEYMLSFDNTRKNSLLQKKLAQVQRRAKRKSVDLLSRQNLLGRKKGTRESIAEKYPDIGKVIESFVKERSVGANAWRRTGVLTFDGNKPIKEKVTYERVCQHLQQVYKRTFGYGTVVQLCIARNRRRKSASRYKGVAHVTFCRARKGFQLKFNPDSHWSSALYRGLNMLMEQLY